MKRHLTDAAIKRIPIPKRDYLELFDLGYPGLCIRVGNGGAKSFVLFHRVGGKLKRSTLGRWPRVSLAEARDAWRAVHEGKPISTTSSTPLFEAVIDEWQRRDQGGNKQSSQYQVSRIVSRDLLPAWRGKPIAEITKRDVIAVLDAIHDRGAPTLARQTHLHLNRFFNWTVERDIITANPMKGLKRGEAKTRDRVLTDDELAKIWSAAPKIGLLGTAVRLLILTGARREEIGQLRWTEIKGDAIHLDGGRTKNGQPHIIPLSLAARSLLDAIPRIAGSDFVFTNNGIKPIVAWAAPKADLDDLAGITDWRIHDLRRTVATGMQKLGVGLQVVEAVLGHVGGSRAGVVGVYQRHSFDAEKRAALEAWGNHVVALTNPTR
jgi:integrase